VATNVATYGTSVIHPFTSRFVLDDVHCVSSAAVSSATGRAMPMSTAASTSVSTPRVREARISPH
jgi:hypothetical protein